MNGIYGCDACAVCWFSVQWTEECCGLYVKFVCILLRPIHHRIETSNQKNVIKIEYIKMRNKVYLNKTMVYIRATRYTVTY